MLIVMNLLFAFIISMAVGILFSLGLGRRHVKWGMPWFFLLLFLGTWALGVWIRPMGPPAWNVQWVPYAVAAAIIAMLLAAATPATVPPDIGRSSEPGESSTDRREVVPTERGAEASARIVNVYFWLLLGIAVAGIVLHYVFD